jgi:hypothetical protein
MATQYANGRIITRGLVLALDAADRNSYVSGSTVWNDVSGNGNNGSLVNGPTFLNNSIVFDGVDDYFVRTDATIKNYTTVTANIWMYLISYKSNYETYISYNSEEGTLVQGWGVRRSLDTTFQYWGGTGNSGIKIYKNGVLAGSSVSTWATVNNINTTGSWEMITVVATGVSSWNTHNRLCIATRSDGLSTATNMQAGSFILYNRELTIQEISQNYNAQKARFNL